MSDGSLTTYIWMEFPMAKGSEQRIMGQRAQQTYVMDRVMVAEAEDECKYNTPAHWMQSSADRAGLITLTFELK